MSSIEIDNLCDDFIIKNSIKEENINSINILQEKKKLKLKKKINKNTINDASEQLPINSITPKHELENFWDWVYKNNNIKITQLERYEKKNSPLYIKKFVSIGGGKKLGTILEQYASFHYKQLQKRHKGKEETGYDHIIKIDNKNIYVEQKSSTLWANEDFKWQHVEIKHKWNILLLCGIDYNEIKFWCMNRNTFNRLISEKKITNQGNKSGQSSEGLWFYYSHVKNDITRIENDDALLQFINTSKV